MQTDGQPSIKANSAPPGLIPTPQTSGTSTTAGTPVALNSSIESRSSSLPQNSSSQQSQTNHVTRVAGNSDDDSGCPLEEYVWAPQGLKPDQVRFKKFFV